MSSETSSTRFHLLDPLRGLSALWVFLFHFHFSAKFEATFPWFVAFAKAGHLGVPIFFVISGYCIAASANAAQRRNEPTSQFLKRRMRRIYPTFWASLVFAISLPFLLEGLSFLKTGTYVAPHPEFMEYDGWRWVRVATLTQAFYPMEGITTLQEKFNSINAVYWSLAIEEQFYLVMAIALALGTRYRAVTALVTLVSVPFFFNEQSYLTGLFLAYWPMFFLGLVMFHLFQASIEPSRLFGTFAQPISAIALTVGVPITFLVLDSLQIRLSHFSFAFLATVSLWFARAFDAGFRRFDENPKYGFGWLTQALAMAGAMSYTIYLMHAKFMFLADAFVRQVLGNSPIARDIGVFALTLVMCYPFYRLFEKPFVGRQRNEIPATDRVGIEAATISVVPEAAVQSN